jgi:hypothetical protein
MCALSRLRGRAAQKFNAGKPEGKYPHPTEIGEMPATPSPQRAFTPVFDARCGRGHNNCTRDLSSF